MIGIVKAKSDLFWEIFWNVFQFEDFVFDDGNRKTSFFFRLYWKAQRWNWVVVLVAILGGFVAVHFMSDSSNVAINPKTIAQLATLGIDAPNGKLVPDA